MFSTSKQIRPALKGFWNKNNLIEILCRIQANGGISFPGSIVRYALLIPSNSHIYPCFFLFQEDELSSSSISHSATPPTLPNAVSVQNDEHQQQCSCAQHTIHSSILRYNLHTTLLLPAHVFEPTTLAHSILLLRRHFPSDLLHLALALEQRGPKWVCELLQSPHVRMG